MKPGGSSEDMKDLWYPLLTKRQSYGLVGAVIDLKAKPQTHLSAAFSYPLIAIEPSIGGI